MTVLVACEFSGIVRDTLQKAGIDAVSCDLLPTEKPGWHYECDVRPLLKKRWSGLIAHPPCTRLANSGVRWLHERKLWGEMHTAAMFFRELLYCDIPHKCIENPIPHKYAIDIIGLKYSQIIHPWQFGHPETKATCLWLEGLPPLKPTNTVTGREARVHREPPSRDRWKNRSRTYQGIADAMAEQWGVYFYD